MPARKQGFGWGSIFWAFALGVVVSIAITAIAAKLIYDAPVPFVTKVQQSALEENALMDGRLDPNKKLYAEGQGTEQKAGTAAVATVTTAGGQTTDAPSVAPADQASGDTGSLDTHRYWVQAGAFSQSADAESMRARIAFIGLDAQISYRNEDGKRLYRVRVGPFDTNTQADEIKQSLADNAIQGTVIRLQD